MSTTTFPYHHTTETYTSSNPFFAILMFSGFKSQMGNSE